jgi:site-specific DNA-adenine methylase
MTYPGGKGSHFQKLINLIPPHRVYIETHVGGAAVARNKKPAQTNILIDIDRDVVEAAAIIKNGDTSAKWQLICHDALEWLKAYDFQGDEFIYCDPPYVMSTRRQHRQIYRYEMSDQDHINLLNCLKKLPCKIMLSGYWSELYGQMLEDWHTTCFQAITRGGSLATEWLWMNYPTPVRLHEYSYLGSNFRERERIKRKKQRWVERLKRMDVLERQALLIALDTVPFD